MLSTSPIGTPPARKSPVMITSQLLFEFFGRLAPSRYPPAAVRPRPPLAAAFAAALLQRAFVPGHRHRTAAEGTGAAVAVVDDALA